MPSRTTTRVNTLRVIAPPTLSLYPRERVLGDPLRVRRLRGARGRQERGESRRAARLMRARVPALACSPLSVMRPPRGSAQRRVRARATSAHRWGFLRVVALGARACGALTHEPWRAALAWPRASSVP